MCAQRSYPGGMGMAHVKINDCRGFLFAGILYNADLGLLPNVVSTGVFRFSDRDSRTPRHWPILAQSQEPHASPGDEASPRTSRDAEAVRPYKLLRHDVRRSR